MTIAVNLTCTFSDSNKDFIVALFENLAKENTGHEFIIILNKQQPVPVLDAPNIRIVQSGPASTNNLLWTIWYEYTLPNLVKRHKVAVVVHGDGICSNRIPIKQCVFINELYLAETYNGISKRQATAVLKKIPTYINKASVIVAASAEQQQQLVQKHPLAGEKIVVIQPTPASAFQPLGFYEKELVKESHSSGKEYFVYKGAIRERNNLFNLLKAFSFFKKRQKSNMQLMVIATSTSGQQAFLDQLKTYKYREEVLVKLDLPPSETVKIMAAAYGAVYPVAAECFPLTPFEAIQCEVPLIMSFNHSLGNLTGDAAVYAITSNFNDIAEKMMLLFKDENKRESLIIAARQLNSDIRSINVTKQFWTVLQDLVTKPSHS